MDFGYKKRYERSPKLFIIRHCSGHFTFSSVAASQWMVVYFRDAVCPANLEPCNSWNNFT